MAYVGTWRPSAKRHWDAALPQCSPCFQRATVACGEESGSDEPDDSFLGPMTDDFPEDDDEEGEEWKS